MSTVKSESRRERELLWQERELLSYGETARVTNLHRVTLWRMSRAGTFPSPRIVGSKRLFMKAEVLAWIAALPQVGEQKAA